VLAANPRTPVTTAAELIALLRANPGRFNFASAGIGSGVHLAGEIFRGISNTQFEMVHYRGGGPGVAALVSGEAQFGTPTMASCLGQVRGGGVRALAVASSHLGAAFQTAIQQSAPRLNELAGVVPRPGYETPDQVMNLVREGVKTYTDVLRAAGVRPE